MASITSPSIATNPVAALAKLISGDRETAVTLAERATQRDPDSRSCQQALAISVFHRALSPVVAAETGEWPQPIDQPLVMLSDAARADLERAEGMFRALMASPELEGHASMVMWHFGVLACMPWRHADVLARLAELQDSGTLPIPLIAWAISRALPFDRVAAGAQCDAKLSDLLRALQIGAENAPSNATTIAMLDDAGQELPPPGEGARIASALKAVEPGNKGGAAQSFEKLCEEALILLFGTELLGWRRQSAIENGYQRVDLIARLQPVRSAFWTTLSADFRARYIVFEFKNYTDPIGQDQIYATERYLYATALRSVAIVIARNGYSENAGRTVRGALRDQGKLILCLDLEEFCSMLQAFDTGDEYEKPLFAKRDDLLMSLAR